MRSIGLICLAVALFSPASADTLLFDNTGQSSGGADPIDFTSGLGPLYDSFTTDAAAGQISILQLSLLGGPAIGSFEVELYADSSNNPGAFLANLGTVSDSSLSSFVLNGNLPVLTANTMYWIGLCDGSTPSGSAPSCPDSNGAQDSTNSNAEWSFAAAAGGTGYDFSSGFKEYVSNQDGTLSDSDLAPYQMSLTEAPLTTPEPASSILILSAVAVLIALRRYLQKALVVSGL